MIQAFWKVLKEQTDPREIAEMRGRAVVDTASLRGGYGRGLSTVETITVPRPMQVVAEREKQEKEEMFWNNDLDGKNELKKAGM